jgi:signal transduction histidine kinase
MTLEGDQATIRAYRGPAAQAAVIGFQFSIKGTFTEYVVARLEPFIVPDLRADTPVTRTISTEARARRDAVYGYVRSWMGVPLVAKETAIGLLVLHHNEPDFFEPRHADLTMALASAVAAAIENARLYEQAQQLAALQERQKLARELHDSVSQALYSIALGARTARTQLDRDPAKVVEPLDYVLSLAQAALAEMRALIFELRPESLEQNGLVAVLTRQADSLRVRHRIEVSTQLGDEPAGALEVKQAVYRIAQEALHNVVKHARAAHVEVSLACRDGWLRLDIQDDGAGFDAGGDFPGHLGLRSMRERATQLGGTLLIDSAPGHGTRVVAKVPLKKGG